jgi:hypothetical protein
MVNRTHYQWYIGPPTHDKSNPISIVYRTSYTWYIEPPIHGIWNPLPIVFWPLTHDISNPLPILFLTPYAISNPYPWSIEHQTHGILNSLPMVYWTPTHDILNPLLMAYQTLYPWYINPTTHGILNALPTVNWTPSYGIMNHLFLQKWGLGVELLWWGAKYYDENLTLQSKCHAVKNTIWHQINSEIYIYSICRCCWNVAIHVICLRLKQKVHTNSLNILGTVVVMIAW